MTTNTALTRAELDGFIAGGLPPLSQEARVQLDHDEVRAWFAKHMNIGTLGEIVHEDFDSDRIGEVTDPAIVPDTVWAEVEGLPLHPSQKLMITRDGNFTDCPFEVRAELWTADDGGELSIESESTTCTVIVRSLGDLRTHLA